ncbi:MAG: hypothetical protein R2705_18465 [Ilumatobacteraceae bacterium]
MTAELPQSGLAGEPQAGGAADACPWHRRIYKPAKVHFRSPPGCPAVAGPGEAQRPGVPDVAWVGDISYIPTGQGWLYLATVIDLGSRRLLGYRDGRHMLPAGFVCDALAMAAGVRGGRTAGIISIPTAERNTSRATTGQPSRSAA